MMKVTLLGDSIRLIGYGKRTVELLGDSFEVYQPAENCRFSKHTLFGLFDWAEGMAGSRIVHWNNGLWDACDFFGDGQFASLQEYETTMLRIADILLSRHEKVIFATTTPVDPRNQYNKNEIIVKYNSHIVPKLQEKGIVINDLFSLVAEDIAGNIAEDLIHLSPKGIELCARQVADMIRATADALDPCDTQAQSNVQARSKFSAPV